MPTMECLRNEADPPCDPIPTFPEPLPTALSILGVRWSQRHKPSSRLLERVKQGLLSFQSVFDDATGDDEYEIQSQMWDPIGFAAKTSDPDTMRADRALREPDRAEFIKAIEAEVSAHSANKHWKVISKRCVPPGVKIIPCVWAMKRKRRIATSEVYKWKARLNLHGETRIWCKLLGNKCCHTFKATHSFYVDSGPYERLELSTNRFHSGISTG